MKQLVAFLEQIPVRLVETLKIGKFHTYHIEMAIVFAVLVVVAIVSQKGVIEWIGVGAVFLTFGYVSVADRLQEVQEVKGTEGKDVEVWCHYKLKYYLWGKEALWFVYFFLLGAWSALVGVFIFLLYPLWRKLWRKYHPLQSK